MTIVLIVLLYCCAKIPEEKQPEEERAYFGLQFQDRVHLGSKGLAMGKEVIVEAASWLISLSCTHRKQSD